MYWWYLKKSISFSICFINSIRVGLRYSQLGKKSTRFWNLTMYWAETYFFISLGVAHKFLASGEIKNQNLITYTYSIRQTFFYEIYKAWCDSIVEFETSYVSMNLYCKKIILNEKRTLVIQHINFICLPLLGICSPVPFHNLYWSLIQKTIFSCSLDNLPLHCSQTEI